MEEWVAIRELAQHKVSVCEISRRTGHDRKTVRRVLAEVVPKPHGNKGKVRVGKLEPYRDYLLQRIEQGCLNSTVLLEEITKLGYAGKISILSHFLTPIRRELVRKQEATERFETASGKQGQVDWAAFGKILDPAAGRWRKVYAFVFTLGYSRAMHLEFVTSCDLEHFLECHLDAFATLGIPETVLYDNLKTAILGRKSDGTPLLPGRFHEFALFHSFSPRFCQPYRARTKGKVERTIGYVRANFWVRVAHEVVAGQLDLAGLNERAREWTEQVANSRVHGTHGEVVAKRLAEEFPLLGKLAGRPRFDTGYHSVRRVGRDGRFSYQGRLYQLDITQALCDVEVVESLDGKLTIRGRCADSRVGQALAFQLVSTSNASPIYRLEPPSSAKPDDDEYTRSRPEAKRLLRLLDPEWVYACAPDVESRDLAVYEEVARAASVG